MPIRFPAPLRPGDTVAVTSPSSGVPAELLPRLEVAIDLVRSRGFRVVVGNCMDGTSHVSAPASERATELNQFLVDPSVRAVIPPWGGETAIDLLPRLDWAAIEAAEPTWFVGYSDISTLITPLTLSTGIATLHGNNLMDSPYEPAAGLTSWLNIVTLPVGGSFSQTPPGRHRTVPHDDWAANPAVSQMTLDATGQWVRLDGTGEIDVTGRHIGGCIDTLCNVAGSPYGDVAKFAQQHAPEGLIVHIEACDEEALSICRHLHGMRLAGFFDSARAVLVGRTKAPDSDTMTQHEAVLDALGSLDIPIIADVDCGHVQPSMPIVNGALGRVQFRDGQGSLVQTLR